jgi:uncharacterized membrane protein
VKKEDGLAARALNPGLQSFVFTDLKTGESRETGFQYGDLNHLQFNPVGFRLMPLEQESVKALQAKWTHQVVDMSRRLVAFKDESIGSVTGWKWDFGDGTTSTEQNPQHAYTRGGDFVVTLEVSGPAGASRSQRVWDVSLR